MPAPGNPNLPLTAFRFVVEIGGLIAGGFAEVSGLQLETEVFEYPEGGENSFIHRLPGRSRPVGNLILKRGIADADILFRWHQDVIQGAIVRQPCTVHLLDEAGEPAVSWLFKDAYPVKWSGPELRGDSATVAVQSVELAHHGIEQAD
jgi:phage tail-like protein